MGVWDGDCKGRRRERREAGGAKVAKVLVVCAREAGPRKFTLA